MASNDIRLVRSVLGELRRHGFVAGLFGGWAEELHRMAAKCTHSDIDVMLIDADRTQLDHYVSQRDEITAKRASHKRAFEVSGVLVELFLADATDSCPVTRFWDTFTYRWPDLGPIEVDGIAVVTAQAVRAYRSDHALISSYRPSR